MKRRIFIATASTSAVTALAGCSNTDLGFGGDRERAEKHYTTAYDNLVKNDEALEAAASSDQLADDWDSETLTQRLGDVRDALDTAEEHAPEEMMPDIENLRAVADFQEAVIAYTDTLIEVQSCWSDAEEMFNNQNFQEAYTHISDCKGSLGDLDDQYNTVTSTHEEIDVEQLGDATDLDYSDRSAKVPGDADGLDVRLSVIDGFDSLMTGINELATGGDQMNNEEYEAAEESFSEAETQFESSAETFNEHIGDPNTPDDLSDTLGTLNCVASNAATGSGYFAQGAAAAQNEEYETAEDHFTTGEEYFTDNCA